MDDILPDTYRKIIENIADGVRVLDENGIIVYANKAFSNLFGFEGKEITGKSVYELYPPEAHSSVARHLTELKAGKTLRYEAKCISRKTQELYVEISAVPITDKEGIYRGSYTVLRDITEKIAFEKKLTEEKNFFNDVVSLCPDSIIGVNRNGIIIIFNKAAERLTGYKSNDVINEMNIINIYGSKETARLIKKNIYSNNYGTPGQLDGFETYLLGRDKHKIPIRLSATLICRDGEEIGSVGFFHDLTNRNHMEAKLRELSVTDSLSGLYNQRHFYTVLAEEISRNNRYKRALSLICFDIDNFKQCNDKLGHLEGDNVIRMVGQILREKLRRSDHAFRYGGDEFMILLPETPLDDAHFSAERVRNEFNSRWSFGSLCDTSCLKQITLSLGVAEANSGELPETFIKRADLAMYEAKRAGGDRTVRAGSQIGKYLSC